MLMFTWQGRGSFPDVSAPKFAEWWRSTEVFEDVAAYRVGGVANLSGGDRPQQLAVARVSAGFFRLFGVPIALGRTFSAEEDQPHGSPVVVISHALWQRQWGSSPAVIGAPLRLDDASYTVIGVVDKEFDGSSLALSSTADPDVWLPLQLDPASTSDAPFFAAARIRDGVSLDTARAQTTIAADAVRRTLPAVMPAEAGLTVEPLQTVVVRDVQTPLLLLLLAGGFVLLIICANIANLLLVRASTRSRELAIRMATGATRRRIISHLLSESLTLSMIGGAFGLLIAWFGTRALVVSDSAAIPRLVSQHSLIDWRVFAFTLIVSVLIAIAFTLVPALRACRLDVDAVLRNAGDRHMTAALGDTLRATFASAQIALAMILLVGASLAIRSFLLLSTVDAGIDQRSVLTMRMAMTGQRFATVDATSNLVSDGLRRLADTAGVEAGAATLTGAPLSGGMSFLNITVPGRALGGSYFAGGFLGGWQVVSPAYFDVFRIPLVAGRVFDDRDRRPGEPVVVINQALARQFWADESPLGHYLLIGQGAGPEFEDSTPRRVIGVVGNVRHVGLQFNPGPTAYVALAQIADNQMTFLNKAGVQLTWTIRMAAEDAELARTIQEALEDATGGTPAVAVQSMQAVTSASVARTELATSLMSVFSGAAMLLAALGVFAVMAYTARERTREIGIRIALGADANRVRTLMLHRGGLIVLTGVVIGMVCAALLARAMQSMLFGVTPYDPIAFVTAPVALAVVSLIAIALPVRQATRVDPAIVLRSQ